MKDFIIIGNMNAIALKDFFPLIKENKVFLRPKHIKYFISKDGELTPFGNIYWYTTFKIDGDMKPLVLTQKYDPKKYPKYDNYDAIEVKRTKDIPYDYDGVMGVPISFLEKYCPEQFEILGSTQRGCHDEVPDTRKYNDYREMRQDGTETGCSGNKTNENANFLRNDGKHNYFINDEGRIIQSGYARILIRRKK